MVLAFSSLGGRSDATLYFRSPGFHNYARYAAFYVHHMTTLEHVMTKKHQYGAFVRHFPGIYNSI